jgi:diacylglycerol kinase (ATP)
MEEPAAGEVVNLRVIINPHAANGRALRLWPKLESLLSRRHRLRCIVSTNPDEMRCEIAKAEREGAEGVLLVGGDGTVHEALPAISETELPFGVLPVGRGNDFARNVGIPLDLRRACGLPTSPSCARMDLPFVNGTPFASIACVGFDAAVNRLARAHRGHVGGTIGYLICVVKALRLFRPFEIDVRLDGELWSGRVMMVAIANGPCYGGGMRIAPSASLNDDHFTVCIVRETSKRELLAQLPRVFRGTHVNHPGVVVRKVRVIQVLAPAGSEVFADGEPCGVLPVECRIGARKLRVLIPDDGAPAGGRHLT